MLRLFSIMNISLRFLDRDCESGDGKCVIGFCLGYLCCVGVGRWAGEVECGAVRCCVGVVGECVRFSRYLGRREELFGIGGRLRVGGWV